MSSKQCVINSLNTFDVMEKNKIHKVLKKWPPKAVQNVSKIASFSVKKKNSENTKTFCGEYLYG